jgi:hypothetical protein
MLTIRSINSITGVMIPIEVARPAMATRLVWGSDQPTKGYQCLGLDFVTWEIAEGWAVSYYGRDVKYCKGAETDSFLCITTRYSTTEQPSWSKITHLCHT